MRQIEGEPTSGVVGTKYSAPEPQRTADYIPSEDANITEAGREPGEAITTGEAPPEEVQTSPPPENPEEASEVQRLRAEVGGLRDALGTRDETHKQKLAELELRMKMTAGAHQPAQQVAPMQLPPGLNAEDSPTWEQFNAVLNQVMPNVQAAAQTQAIRATWDVTSAEEMAVLQEYPHLTQAEPERTRLIREAALLKRPPKEEPTAPAPVSVQTAAPPEGRIRQSERTVPHVERASAPAVHDAPPVAEIEAAHAEYDAASRITDFNERLTARKAAYNKILRLQGTDPNKQFEGQFKHE